MKQIKVTPETHQALNGSIKKWIRVVNEGVCGTEAKDCPLCMLHNPFYAPDAPVKCDQCPIQLDTDWAFCEGTPYDQYHDVWESYEEDEGNLAHHAKRMLDYLVGLEDRCIVDEAATFNEVMK